MTKIYEKLTADWKAGKLPLGYFYVKYKNREIGIQDNFIDNFLGQLINPIIQVIAPVPTYDEYKAMQAELAEHRHYCCCSENEVMRLKLAEMEELLKECLPIVSAEIMTWQIRGGEESYKRGQDLLTRINSVIGESKE